MFIETAPRKIRPGEPDCLLREAKAQLREQRIFIYVPRMAYLLPKLAVKFCREDAAIGAVAGVVGNLRRRNLQLDAKVISAEAGGDYAMTSHSTMREQPIGNRSCGATFR
jgi:hypothetical protein